MMMTMMMMTTTTTTTRSLLSLFVYTRANLLNWSLGCCVRLLLLLLLLFHQDRVVEICNTQGRLEMHMHLSQKLTYLEGERVDNTKYRICVNWIKVTRWWNSMKLVKKLQTT